MCVRGEATWCVFFLRCVGEIERIARRELPLQGITADAGAVRSIVFCRTPIFWLCAGFMYRLMLVVVCVLFAVLFVCCTAKSGCLVLCSQVAVVASLVELRQEQPVLLLGCRIVVVVLKPRLVL